jgi:DNA-binding CsgD family transcriptional regulator
MTPTAHRYLTLLCHGMTYKEIAVVVGRSEDTVRKLFQKWRRWQGCDNNEQLVYKWITGLYNRPDTANFCP